MVDAPLGGILHRRCGPRIRKARRKLRTESLLLVSDMNFAPSHLSSYMGGHGVLRVGEVICMNLYVTDPT